MGDDDMALLDSIKGLLGGAGGRGGGNAAILGQLSGMLTGKSGDAGGLSRLVEQFQSAGLGDKVASWVGHGANAKLSSDEVEQAIGSDRINEMSKETGQPAAAVKHDLAGAIPNLVNKLTPDGKMPDPSALLGMVKGLDLGKLLGK
jgi:uncharacterized protein YidB (DUF937 family)